MSSRIIKSKLMPPRVCNSAERPRLLKLVQAQKNKRVVVTNAGAGYGKTTFFAQLYASLEGTSIWHRLDQRDNDPSFFISHLIAGADRQIPGINESLAVSLGSGCDFGLEKEKVLTALLTSTMTQGSGPVHFFFDDFHNVNGGDAVADMVHFLVKNLPDGWLVLVACREKPNLYLSKWRAQRALLEIGMEELRFSPEETAAFFRSFNGTKLTDRQIMHVDARGEGWPLALSLSKFLDVQDGAKEAPEERLNLGAIRNYLAKEVWGSLEHEYRKFLMQSSMMEPVDPEVCDLVLNPGKPSALLLKQALERNLMTIRLDDGARYRFHILFRDFLRHSCLAEFGPAQVKELHLKYAEVFLEMDQAESAIDHLFSAEEVERAVGVVESCGLEVLKSGRSKLMSGWLENISLEYFDKHPWLCYFRAVLQERDGRLSEALETLDRAARGFETTGLRKGLYLTAVAKAEVLTNAAQYQDGLEAAEAALDWAENSSKKIKARGRMATCHLLLGRTQEAMDLLNEAGDLCDESTAATSIAIAMLDSKYSSGDFRGIVSDTETLFENAELVTDMRDRFTLLFYRALALFETGRYQESLDLLAASKTFLGGEHWGFERALGCIRGQNSLYAGDAETGRKILRQLLDDESEDKFMGPDSALNQLGAHERRQGRQRRALEIHNKALAITQKEGTLYSVANARLQICADNLRLGNGAGRGVDEELNKVFAIADGSGYEYLKMQVHFYRAELAFIRKRYREAFTELGACLDLAARNLHSHFLVQEGRGFLDLLSLAFEHGSEVDYLAEVLGKIGPDSLMVLAPLLRSTCPKARAAAVRATAAVAGPRAASLVRRMTRDQDATVRETARGSLEDMRAGIGSPEEVLTRREMQILSLMGGDLSNRDIGTRLYISEATVKAHVTRIFNKLCLNKRSQAASFFNPQMSECGGAQ